MRTEPCRLIFKSPTGQIIVVRSTQGYSIVHIDRASKGQVLDEIDIEIASAQEQHLAIGGRDHRGIVLDHCPDIVVAIEQTRYYERQIKAAQSEFVE